MLEAFQMTIHARNRSSERSISEDVIDLILGYGSSIDAGDGAQKFALTKRSLRAIRQDFGSEISAATERYRRVYVVAAAGRVITAAFSNHPLLH